MVLYLGVLKGDHAFQVEKLMLDSSDGTMGGNSLEQTMNWLLTGTFIHALRRSIELDGSVQMLKAFNIMSKVAKEKL